MIRRVTSMGLSAQRVTGPLLLLMSCLTSACLSARDEAQETPQGAGACAAKCHGDGTTAAPPVDLDGNTSPTARGVGAHRQHLDASSTHVAFECKTCHQVPATTEAPGHADTARPAEILFDGAAVAQGSGAAYDPETLKCATSYCHGGPGHFAWPAAAVWNEPKDSAAACGTSCHSLPPGGTHPQADACESCHADTAGPGHTIKDASLHINGEVEVKASGCNGCHGSAENDAPPKDTSGLSDTALVSVGAHQAHLGGGAFSKAVTCETCHVVPTDPGDPGHMDTGSPAELTFSGLATKNAAPAWDHDAATCANTYCHGSSALGGARPAPVWNAVDGSQASCGSCHSLPPPAPHPQADACEACHDETAGPGMTIINRDKHIDGVVDVKGGSCQSCHGSADNNAPPVSVGGSSATSDVGVGAHQAHLSGGVFSRPVECQECHLVPTSVDQAGHLDSDLPAELQFTGVAVADSASPAWDHGTVTCSGSYCHGGTLGGGSNAAPKWTTVDGTQAQCGSCHGLPPPAPHVANDKCELCHDETVGAGMTIIDRAKHIDGIVEVKSMACNACHGSATNDAPPTDLTGSSDTTQVTVGAHQSHLSGGAFSRSVQCVECHVVPASLADPEHIDATLPAEVTFSGVSTADGAAPAWNRTTAECANAYCHGATLPGGSNKTPQWTKVNGTEATCGACHALPPPPPHVANVNCELCHTPTAGPGLTIANRATHIDGTVTIPGGPCNLCHGDATSYAPPNDTNGNSATTFPGVGAHRKHLDAAQMKYAKPLACDVCHPVPPLSTVHLNGSASVVFSGIATGSLSSSFTTHASSPVYNDAPTYTCSQVYCHGDWTETDFTSGASRPTPQWNLVNGSQANCGGCHSLPPPAPHPASALCSQCHPATIDADLNLNLDTHVNGFVDFAP